MRERLVFGLRPYWNAACPGTCARYELAADGEETELDNGGRGFLAQRLMEYPKSALPANSAIDGVRTAVKKPCVVPHVELMYLRCSAPFCTVLVAWEIEFPRISPSMLYRRRI